MGSPTRFLKVGTQGRIKTAVDADSFRTTLVIPIKPVANATANLTGVSLPPYCQISTGVVKVISPEVTGLTKTLSIGIQGGAANAILDAVDVSAGGFQGVKVGDNFNGGAELTFTLGSADFVELDCVAIIEVMGDS